MKVTVTLAAGALAIILVGCGGNVAAPSASMVANSNASSSAGPAATASSSPSPAATAKSTVAPTPSATPDQEEAGNTTLAPVDSPVPAPELPTFPKGAIGTGKALKSVGKIKTVCGEVVNATYAKSSSGSPTFLNLDEARGRFTIVIWKEYRPTFDRAPEKLFDGEWVCIQGKITSRKGVPQIRSLGGDIAHPGSFIPMTGEARSCLAKGASMSIWCTVVVDEQRINNEMYLDALDAEGDIYDDLYGDAQSDLYDDLYGDLSYP